MASDPGQKDFITKRIRVPAVQVLRRAEGFPEQPDLPLFDPVRVEVVGVGRVLSERLATEPSLVHSLSPDEFEQLICERLFAMGFEPRRTGAVNRRDGGIDIFFWPRLRAAFPLLGAAQVKHHRDPTTKEKPSTVREFAGTITGHPLAVGLLITNTSFSPDAEWYARERAKLLRLRDFGDIKRWLLDNFSDEAEWREISSSIEVCPGVVVRIR
jgi:hypothetical protein